MSENPAQDVAPPDGVVSLRSVASLVAERPLKLGEALGVLRDAAEALAALHAGGAAHGAACAENIVLDAGGAARLCHDTLEAPHPSPEQRQGSPPDARSDVYGLGATIVGLLGEARPLPDPIERMLATMTAEEPASRYQSMDEVLTALKACELMTGYRAFRPGQEAAALRPRRHLLAVAVVALGLVMLALALLAVFGTTPPARGKKPESHKELLDEMVPLPREPAGPPER